jgi:uncharacterized protein YuzE
MKVRYDRAADAVYFRLDDSPILESEEVQPGVIVDFNRDNQVVGVEILGVRARAPRADLTQVQFEVG